MEAGVKKVAWKEIPHLRSGVGLTGDFQPEGQIAVTGVISLKPDRGAKKESRTSLRGKKGAVTGRRSGPVPKQERTLQARLTACRGTGSLTIYGEPPSTARENLA